MNNRINDSRDRKWEEIIDELNKRKIEYEIEVEDNGYYMDKLIELIKIDGCDMFGLFEDEDRDLLICEGDCLEEINYRKSVKNLVDKNLEEIKKLNIC